MKLTDQTFDKKNACRRYVRVSGTIEHSLNELGAGGSIVIDKHGQIIAGNGVIENASKAGITEVHVIQSDGTKIVAVQRVDLDLDADPKARQPAISDNRTAELRRTLAKLSNLLSSGVALLFDQIYPLDFTGSQTVDLTARQPRPGGTVMVVLSH